MAEEEHPGTGGEGSPPPPADFIERAKALGAKKAKVIRTGTITTAPWVRMKCRYGCGGYNTSLCCPPYSPTPAETQEVIDGYETALLFEADKGSPSKIARELEREIFLAGYHKAMGFGAGGCRMCKEGCAFEKGCRNGRKARPSMEACGIDVFGTVRANGFEIDVVKTREHPARYFGVVLVE
jgi:predicted metal-binding protein